MTPTSLPRAGSATQRLRTAARQPSELRRARNPRFDGHAAEANALNDGPGDGPDRELGIGGPWIVCHAAACAAGENDRRVVIGVEEARASEIVVAHLYVGIDARGFDSHHDRTAARHPR